MYLEDYSVNARVEQHFSFFCNRNMEMEKVYVSTKMARTELTYLWQYKLAF